jgi:hypothetical protein
LLEPSIFTTIALESLIALITTSRCIAIVVATARIRMMQINSAGTSMMFQWAAIEMHSLDTVENLLVRIWGVRKGSAVFFVPLLSRITLPLEPVTMITLPLKATPWFFLTVTTVAVMDAFPRVAVMDAILMRHAFVISAFIGIIVTPHCSCHFTAHSDTVRTIGPRTRAFVHPSV